MFILIKNMTESIETMRKVLNPLTNRLIKIDSAVYKKLLRSGYVVEHHENNDRLVMPNSVTVESIKPTSPKRLSHSDSGLKHIENTREHVNYSSSSDEDFSQIESRLNDMLKRRDTLEGKRRVGRPSKLKLSTRLFLEDLKNSEKYSK